MNKMWVLLFGVALAASGCQEKEEEGVDLDRIVRLIEEEEPAEWKPPEESELISGHRGPENFEGLEPCDPSALR